MSQAIAASRIAQQAFRYAEMAPLSSFGDDSDQARAAAEQLPIARDDYLRRADWSFASKLLSLPETTPEVADEDLPHAYVLPPSVLAVRNVWPELTRWRRDAELLLCADEPGPLKLRVTVQVDNENRLPPDFRNAVAYLLAARLSPVYATSANRATSLEQRAEAALVAAMRADRGQASAERWDGGVDEGDWSDLVTR
ncbi:hypothetical protein P2H44_22680 [Albimonas sp. CAU 1670]|uniref:hypothetical protein n=1 Tax=Albimonas sp. CAU 1670 TaxID=3032599 RepID=UPI0023DB4D8A|nr:hypothetical protein [Albimonas sp. CAU 1670]MDF2235371.1 hypothetical protein [Albimonas sp. CAU 1670]